MSGSSLKKTDYDITSTYDLCVRAFRTTRKLLKLNIKLHDDAQQPCHQTIEQGDIFLFNHFARFETFIPQYLIHAETGSYCRSIASSEFFEDSRFAPFLRSIGVVPNDMPDLFPFIAKEILHGRKLVIFPEGGMVKDKRVVDDKGRFGIYSRTAMERRKHHRGAAVIALAVDAFKTALLRDYSTGNYQQIERWAEQLEFPNTESLLMKALKPTSIVPSHITFYPIRVNDNILHQAAKLFNKGINKRFAEELIIEGNLLFRHTDMDIRFSTPLIIGKYWKWWEKQLLPNVVHRFESIQELFNLTPASGHWGGRIHSIGMKAKSNLVRDDYMQAMYKAVTINLSHIASYLILQYFHAGIKAIACKQFHKALYIGIKAIQQSESNLHRSLKNPDEYDFVIDGDSNRLQQFLDTVHKMGLLSTQQDHYILQEKLIDEFHFDEIRTENLISVYANELAPLSAITRMLKKSFDSIDSIDAQQLADFSFDDQLLAYQWDKKQFQKERHLEINRKQTFTRDANWFRFMADNDNAPGIVLVHGFLASPAEMIQLGDKLNKKGFNVIGVRLKGHGTSPWDLAGRNWQDWADSVKRGFDIIRASSREVHIIGFSTGGLLALHQAVAYPDEKLASVITVSSPVEFQSKQMKFVPILHQANRISRLVSADGLIPFRPNDSEHPDVNYAHIPIQALYQLQKLIDNFFHHPAALNCPVTLFQSTEDPVVVPESVYKLYNHIVSTDKQIVMIDASRHGILYEDTDNTQQKIIDHVLSRRRPDQHGPETETTEIINRLQ